MTLTGVQLFRYVDLFAGCGGLSLGLENAGGEHVLAVEKSDMAALTYYRNFIDPSITPETWKGYLGRTTHEQVRAGLAVKELRSVLDDESVDLSSLEIDVVVGGPPCQGFSLAGRRNPADSRNRLPWEFLEFVERTAPKVVVIENVVGMSRAFAGATSSAFHELRIALSQTQPGYVVQGLLVNAKHFGAPQHRPRLMLLGIRAELAGRLGYTASDQVWPSDYVDSADAIPMAPTPTISSENVQTVRDAVGDLLLEHEPLMRSAYLDRLGELKVPRTAGQGEFTLQNHVRRRHSEAVVTRFRIYQWLAVEGLSHRLISALSYGPADARRSAERQLRAANYPAFAPDGVLLASDAEAMLAVVQSSATRKHSQKALRWDEPAKTVVTLPDDYVHPLEPRILTVRELARFQGFPDDFVFMGRETTGAHRRRFEVPQYSQVGNAVSPFLGLAMGKLIDSVVVSAADESIAA